MKRWLVAPVVILAVALIGPSTAEAAAPRSFGDVLRMLGGATPVPQEWDGVWAREDSIYLCDGPLQIAVAQEDTICGGSVYDPGNPNVLDCTGTATATTIDMTCTGAFEVFPDCQSTYTIHTVMTRTGDSYHSVSTISSTYSGTGEGCDLLPLSCQRIVSDGTRTGAAPADYCVTPTRRHTWGQLKSIYR